MRFLAAYVLKGRMQAVVVTAVTALLAAWLLLLPVIFLSGATVALVTLRYGLKAGLQLSFLATLISVLLLLALQQPLHYSGFFLLALWLPVWTMATSLRRTASPARSVILAVAFGVMILVGFTWGVDNPAQWGLDLQRWLTEPMAQRVPEESLTQMRAMLGEPGQMSGVVVMTLTITLICSLLLGRWWQSLLFNPGGFGKEYRQLRLGRWAALTVLLLLLFQLMLQEGEGSIALLRDTLILMQLPFILQGVAVAHWFAKAYALQRGWLVVMYLLLLLGPMAMLLMLVGLVDNWFDFRSKFGQGKQTDIE